MRLIFIYNNLSKKHNISLVNGLTIIIDGDGNFEPYFSTLWDHTFRRNWTSWEIIFDQYKNIAKCR